MCEHLTDTSPRSACCSRDCPPASWCTLAATGTAPGASSANVPGQLFRASRSLSLDLLSWAELLTCQLVQPLLRQAPLHVLCSLPCQLSIGVSRGRRRLAPRRGPLLQQAAPVIKTSHLLCRFRLTPSRPCMQCASIDMTERLKRVRNQVTGGQTEVK